MQENIDLARRPGGAAEKIDEWIDFLGVRSTLDSTPVKCSVGQRQRVELIRALSAGPRLCLLDEPVAALDDGMEKMVERVISDAATNLHIGFVIVSHSTEILTAFNSVEFRLFKLNEGKLSPGD